MAAQMNFEVRIYINGKLSEQKQFVYLTEAQTYATEVKKTNRAVVRIEIINLAGGYVM